MKPAPANRPLPEIIRVFTHLGLFSFGGPAAHIAMMEDEIVQKRKWVSKEHFVDMLGFTNLIPGPNSTEMAIFLGYARGGRPGLFLAGASFILPAMVIVLILAVIYQSYGKIPAVTSVFDGVKPVILAIVVQAMYRLSRTIIRKWDAAILAVLVLAASLLGIREIPLLLAAGVLMLAVRWLKDRRQARLLAFDPFSIALLIFLVSAVLLIRFKINSTWLILGGGILGFLLPLLGISL